MRSEPLDPAITWIGAHHWLSLHLYCEQDLRPILTSMQAVVGGLFVEGTIDRFFFIRYFDEGGLHVRLRLRIHDKADAEVCCSRISETWESLCTICPVRFEPETERYGGAGVLSHSLEFFSISSLQALVFESRFGDRPPSRKLTLQLCTLLWQAWGFACGAENFLSLLNYFSSWAERHRKIIALADEFFDRRKVALVRLVEGELDRLSSLSLAENVDLTSASSLSNAARALSQEVTGIDPLGRWSIGSSQMHMTANRLGLTNEEESYISRLLVRTVLELAEVRPDLWQRASDVIKRVARAPMASLQDLTQHYLEALLSFQEAQPKADICRN